MGTGSLLLGSFSLYSWSFDHKLARAITVTHNRPCSRRTISTTVALPLACLHQQQKQQPQQAENDFDSRNSGKNNPFSSLDELNFLLKLTAGSVGGAALIKYGSAFFPSVTRPNILQALLMIGIPVLISLLLLIKESRNNTQNQDPF